MNELFSSEFLDALNFRDQAGGGYQMKKAADFATNRHTAWSFGIISSKKKAVTSITMPETPTHLNSHKVSNIKTQ